MDAEFAVVGGGIMGLCAAWRLAAAGRDVVLFERYDLGHSRGSSHGATRVFRYAYPLPLYVRMAMASLPLWRELEDGADEIVRITGGIDVGEPDRVDAIADALSSCGAEVRRSLGDAEAFAGPMTAGRVGIYSPDTGVIAADRAVRVAAERARRDGARILEATPILGVSLGEDEVVLDTREGRFRARRCIVAAGAWTAPLLAPLGVALPLRVTKESVFYVRGELPYVTIWWDDVPWYAVPGLHGAPGVKVGEHGNGIEIDPDESDRSPDPDARHRLSALLRRTLPAIDPDPILGEGCLYTSTPDDAFILDVRGPLVVASPCSGHGFKFAPLIGETLACLATGQLPPVDTTAFRLDKVARW